MLYIKKLLIENGIKIRDFAQVLGMSFSTLQNKLACKIDFTINDLELIKCVLCSRNILIDTFDIGLLVDDNVPNIVVKEKETDK